MKRLSLCLFLAASFYAQEGKSIPIYCYTNPNPGQYVNQTIYIGGPPPTSYQMDYVCNLYWGKACGKTGCYGSLTPSSALE